MLNERLSEGQCCRYVIISADDFGISPEVNRAILKSFTDGFISSASIMANMPSFGMACRMAHQFDLTDKIGVHLNLSEGRPLSKTLLNCKRFCRANGLFRRKINGLVFLDSEEKKAIKEELDAQIQKCIDNGIRPAYIDSHHHYHTEWAVNKIVAELAFDHNITAVRIAFNCLNKRNILKKFYRYSVNLRLRSKGLARTAYFGTASEINRDIKNICGSIEIMVHPVLATGGIIVNKEDGQKLQSIQEHFLPWNHSGPKILYTKE